MFNLKNVFSGFFFKKRVISFLTVFSCNNNDIIIVNNNYASVHHNVLPKYTEIHTHTMNAHMYSLMHNGCGSHGGIFKLGNNH